LWKLLHPVVVTFLSRYDFLLIIITIIIILPTDSTTTTEDSLSGHQQL